MSKTVRAQHYFLASTQVVFRTKGVDVLQQMFLNTTIANDRQIVIAKNIGRVQQTVQMMLHQRLPGEIEDVVDVFIMGFSYLGKMTQDEFMAGMVDTVTATGNA